MTPVRLMLVAAGTAAVYGVVFVVWSAAVFLGFGWFTHALNIPRHLEWERDPSFFRTLILVPPIVPALIFATFALVRSRAK